eukprot:2355101-Prymnesium_polylepis.2
MIISITREWQRAVNDQNCHVPKESFVGIRRALPLANALTPDAPLNVPRDVLRLSVPRSNVRRLRVHIQLVRTCHVWYGHDCTACLKAARTCAHTRVIGRVNCEGALYRRLTLSDHVIPLTLSHTLHTKRRRRRIRYARTGLLRAPWL